MKSARICFLILLVVFAECNGEIHRAKAINSKPHHVGRAAAIKNKLSKAQELNAAVSSWNLTAGLERLQDWTESLRYSSRWHVWIYSLISAGLVGLSGIFPLLVIPLEAGEALKKGGSANNKLKLLLSFAVGGLLGDVFLHLLPEAWAHLDKLGGNHDGNINIGCWVLAGLLLFMIIEKLFPESDDDENQDETADASFEGSNELMLAKNAKNELNKQIMNGSTKVDEAQELMINCVAKKGSVKSRKNLKKIAVTENEGGDLVGLSKRSRGKERAPVIYNTREMKDKYGNEKMNISNAGYEKTVLLTKVTASSSSKANDNCSLGKRNLDGKTRPENIKVSHETRIKTSGWLNLFANVVDNFTHGLAIGGSYSFGIKTGLITTFAILLHEVPHEIGDFAILLRAGFSRWKAAKAQMLTATGGLLGAVTALTAESAESAGDRTAWILPFTSGGFIYIAMVTVLPELLHENTDARHSLKQFLLVCTGIGVMAAVTLLID